MTVLAGAHMLHALQTHLARAEDLHPDWTHQLLKFNLRYARLFQLRCEGQPRRHAELLALPEYQEVAGRVWQLQQEYSCGFRAVKDSADCEKTGLNWWPTVT